MLAIASCTPPDVDWNDPTTITRVGHVLLTEVTTPLGTHVTGQAVFETVLEPFDAAALADPFGAHAPSCTVSTAGTPSGGVALPLARGHRLNVGEAVTLRQAAAGDYATFALGDGSYALYGATAPLPLEGLTLHVPPSATFPTFEAVAFAAGSHVALAASFDPTAVRPDTEFAWDAVDPASAVLLVGAQGQVSFSCLVPDVGTFRFPASTAADLVAAGFGSGELLAVGRLSYGKHKQADAYLLTGALRLTTPVEGSAR